MSRIFHISQLLIKDSVSQTCSTNVTCPNIVSYVL